MVKLELDKTTIAVLISGLYCVSHEVNAIAIPESVWLEIAEKLEFFLLNWDYSVISFEDWVNTCLTIYPKAMLSDEDIEYLQKNTLYWEKMNGNAILSISMDIGVINP